MQQPIPIPMPAVLDAQRPHLTGSEQIADAESQVSMLREALEQACDYGQALWRQLDAVRNYLLLSLPSDPRTPGAHRVTAAPAGPDDDEGWQRWMTAFAETTGALAGPQGDSGFGTSEARREADQRRCAPNLRLLAQLPELTADEPAADSPAPAHPRPSAGLILGVAAATLAVRGLVARRVRPSRAAGSPKLNW